MTKLQAIKEQFARLSSIFESQETECIPASKMGVVLSSTGQSSVDIADLMKTRKFQEDLAAIEAIHLDLPVFLRRK